MNVSQCLHFVFICYRIYGLAYWFCFFILTFCLILLLQTKMKMSCHCMFYGPPFEKNAGHYNDVIMGTMASQITSLTVVYSAVYSGADQRKHQSSASLAFVRGIHRWPVNSPHKGPVTRKMFPFDDDIMSAPGLQHCRLSMDAASTLFGTLNDMFCCCTCNIDTFLP